jgi:hypothetical protein
MPAPLEGVTVPLEGALSWRVKATALLATPFAVTTTFTLPGTAPTGAVAVMLPALQLVTVAVVPLNVTVPLDPKLLPVMVTAVPTVPEVTERLVIDGTPVPTHA